MKIGTNWIDDVGRLNGTIGLETLNSVIAPIIKAGCEVPDRRARIFGTTEDNQDQIVILVQAADRLTGNAIKVEESID